jgi:cytidylate kinase
MKTRTRGIHQIVEEQAQRWQRLHAEKKEKKSRTPVITFSREPGSGGRLIAEGVAERLGMDLFNQEVIHAMAESAKVSTRLLETLDERGVSILEDWVSSLISERHLWPDEYLKHLLKVIGTIGRHGHAVIVGRGANFVLPPENRLRVRVIAPREVRVQNVARQYDVPVEEARRRVVRTGSDRKAFIRKYFNANIEDPLNYDLVINTGSVALEAAALSVCALLPAG